MTTAISCTGCGAPIAAGISATLCEACLALEAAPIVQSSADAREARTSAPTRRFDAGRILKTGAHAQPTHPAGTMPRLMTADVKAAVGPAESAAAAVALEEAFTFAEPTAASATQEAWSIGEAEASEPESERPPRHARSGLPKTLIGAAALLALGAIAALLHFGTSPSTAANAQTDDAVAPQAANAGSGSGQPEATRPSPAGKSSEPSQAKASRNLSPAATPAPSPAVATSGVPEGTAPTAAEKPVAPRDFDALMREGRVALDRGDIPAALSSFQGAAALKPLSVEAITGVARAQAASENTAAAIKSFERAVAVQNDYLPAWSGLAHLRAISGNTDGAIDAYRHILEINPNAREAKTAREALEDLGASSP